jgi:hypothetical protein
VSSSPSSLKKKNQAEAATKAKVPAKPVQENKKGPVPGKRKPTRKSDRSGQSGQSGQSEWSEDAPGDDWNTSGDPFGNFSEDFSDGADYGDDYEADDYGSKPGRSSRPKDPYGGAAALPPRKKGASRGSSGGRQSASAAAATGWSISSLGVFGWVLMGVLAGAVSIVLATFVGYTRVPFLIGLMALVTGPLVGGAVRFAAGESTGLGPGLLALAIAFVSILGGKVGACYVGFTGMFSAEELAKDENGQVKTVEQRVAERTTEPLLISEVADKVQDEWLAAGKLTEEQLEAFDAMQESESAWDEDDEEVVEGVGVIDLGDVPGTTVTAEPTAETKPWTPDQAYPPEIWQEAQSRWNAMSAEQRQKLIDDVRAGIVEEDRSLQEVAPKARIVVALLAAAANIFLPLSNPFFFFSGLASAYRLGSHLSA